MAVLKLRFRCGLRAGQGGSGLYSTRRSLEDHILAWRSCSCPFPFPTIAMSCPTTLPIYALHTGVLNSEVYIFIYVYVCVYDMN